VIPVMRQRTMHGVKCRTSNYPTTAGGLFLSSNRSSNAACGPAIAPTWSSQKSEASGVLMGLAGQNLTLGSDAARRPIVNSGSSRRITERGLTL